MPDVSVVIPAYSQPAMLSEALLSVQQQTAPPVEIIIIDDCSAEPLEFGTEFSPDLPIRFIRHDINRGPAGSVVHGIRESKCDLVTTLNHDDIWEPRFLERLGGELERHPEASFAFCDHGIMLAGGERDEALSAKQSARFGRSTLEGGVLSGKRLCEALLDKAVAASSFALVRREAIDLDLVAAGGDMWDYFLSVGACRAGGTAVFVAERLGWYRFSPTMLTTTWADPAKQVEMSRLQATVLVVMLRSPQFASVHGAVRRRLLLAVRHALAAAVRTHKVRSVGRVAVRVGQGARDARCLTGTSAASAASSLASDRGAVR